MYYLYFFKSFFKKDETRLVFSILGLVPVLKDPERASVHTASLSQFPRCWPVKALLPYDVRFLPVSQYLLELASGVWVLECGVLTSREA